MSSRTRSKLTTALMALLASLIHGTDKSELIFALRATAEHCEDYAREQENSNGRGSFTITARPEVNA